MTTPQQSSSSSLVNGPSPISGKLISENYEYAYNTLRHVFQHLEPMELFCAYHVCSTWRSVIELEKLQPPTIPLYSCLKHSKSLEESFGTDVEGLEVYFEQDLEPAITEPLLEVLKKQPHIRKLSLIFQGNGFFGLLAPASLPQVEEAKIYVFAGPDENLEMLPFLEPFPNLTSLILEIDGGNTMSLDGFHNCTFLKHLRLSIKSDNYTCSWRPITSLKSLETLILGGSVVEGWMKSFSFGVCVIKDLPNLTHLGMPIIKELNHIRGRILVEFLSQVEKLEKLSFYGLASHLSMDYLFKRISALENIKHLFLFVTPSRQSLADISTLYSSMLRGVCQMKKLESLTWLYRDYYRTYLRTKSSKPSNLFCFFPTSSRHAKMMAVSDIEPFLQRSLPHIKDVRIVKVSSKGCPERYVDDRVEQHCFKCKHLNSTVPYYIFCNSNQ